jgi:hypothetical protein
MHNPQCPEPQTAGLDEIFFHYGFDVARGDCVEIEDVGDGDSDGLIFAGGLNSRPPNENPASEADRVPKHLLYRNYFRRT